jgi:hypothetical protein
MMFQLAREALRSLRSQSVISTAAPKLDAPIAANLRELWCGG